MMGLGESIEHDWFAWKPVRTLCKRIAWLRTIKRRAEYYNPDPGADFWGWVYRWPNEKEET